MAWTKYKEVKYGTTIPGSTLTDFPLLFSVTSDSDIAAELTSGGGIKFTSADGSTDLDFGLYPSTALASGTVLARVKVSPASTASTGDVICRLYYSSAESTTEDKAGTFSNNYGYFLAMEEDPSGSAPQMLDWVGNANIGTSSGSMTSGDLVTGAVGNGLDFDGSNDYITVPGTAGNRPTSEITLECQAKPAATSTQILAACRTGTIEVSGATILVISNKFQFYASVNGTSWGVTLAANANFSTGTNYTVAGTFTSGTQKLYVDGVAQTATGSASGSLVYKSSRDWHIGGDTTGTRFSGVIDEMKLSTVARSANWLAYSHTNERSNSSTVTLGTEQTGGGSSAPYHAIQQSQPQRRFARS